MKKLLIALATTVALVGPAAADKPLDADVLNKAFGKAVSEGSEKYCRDEFLAIQAQFQYYMNAWDEEIRYIGAAQELNEPLSAAGIEARREKEMLDRDVKTRAQTYVKHTECNPVDRAHIKKFTS
jgi:hypothetical protein